MGRASRDGLCPLCRWLESAPTQAGAHRRRNRGATMKAARQSLRLAPCLFATRSPVRERKIAQIPQKSACRSHQWSRDDWAWSADVRSRVPDATERMSAVLGGWA
jgi:hypothetical protein